MDKIRIGNDIHIEWLIFRDNQPEVFEGKDVEVRLIHTRTRDVMPLEWVISDGVVSATFYGKDQIDTGDYKLMLVENNGAPNMATIDECKAFTLVQCSCQERKEEPSTSLQLYKVQLASSFALSGGGNINVEGYPNVDELEEVKELSGDENIIITDTEGNKKTTVGKLKEYVVKDVPELPPFRIFETETDYNAVKSELEDCVVCLRDTGVMLYHVHKEIEDGEEGGGEIEDKYIRFADPEVQRILVENFSADKVGMTSEDIEKVTSIGTVFKGNTEITSFDELEKFTGVTSISASAFSGCSKLSSIDLSNIKSTAYGAFMSLASLNKIVLRDLITVGEQCFGDCANAVFVGGLPASITTLEQKTNFLNCANLVGDIILPNLVYIPQSAFEGTGIERILDLGRLSELSGAAFYRCKKLTLAILPNTFSVANWYTFMDCTALANVICEAITPPTLKEGNNFSNTPIASGTGTFYVPDTSVEAYKTATNWSTYADRIKGISELPIDNPELYDEIKDYLG